MLIPLQNDIYIFLLYALFSIVIFYLMPDKYKNFILFFTSLLFYSLCDYRFLLLVLAETIISFYLGKKIQKNSKTKVARIYLIYGIILIITILFLFKYLGVFSQILNNITFKIILPIGISYYSFRIISYLVDIYKGIRSEEKNIINYCVYIMFFPHLLCGPIIRSEEMLEQLNKGITINCNLIIDGILLVINGLFKKKVIADNIGNYVNLIFNAPSDYPSIALWLSAFLYSIQLYCDFSGYSDIAIGITKMFSLNCSDNFNRPYLSQNMREFWSRWHISLSQWLRDYIYIPLGGNRTSKSRNFLNKIITFSVCGIWHGEQLHYLVWGIYHGIINFITPKKKFTSLGAINNPIMRCLNTIFTFVIAMFGWIIFRANNIKESINYIMLMFSHLKISYNDIMKSILPFTSDYSCLSYCLTLFIMIILLYIKEIHEEKSTTHNVSTIWYGVFLICIMLFGSTGGSSFLYANY